MLRLLAKGLLLCVLQVNTWVVVAAEEKPQPIPFGVRAIDPFRKDKADEKKKPTGNRPNVFQDVMDKKIDAPRKDTVSSPAASLTDDIVAELKKATEGEDPFANLQSDTVEDKMPVARPKRMSKKERDKFASASELFSDYDSTIAKGISSLFKSK